MSITKWKYETREKLNHKKWQGYIRRHIKKSSVYLTRDVRVGFIQALNCLSRYCLSIYI